MVVGVDVGVCIWFFISPSTIIDTVLQNEVDFPKWIGVDADKRIKHDNNH